MNMWLQFYSQNVHFAIHLFAALVMLGICWLYLDAWSIKHQSKELFKWLGFALLGISFLVQATTIEQSVLGAPLLGRLTESLVIGFRLGGFALVIFGNILDPLQAKPKNEGLKLASDDSSAGKSGDKQPEHQESKKAVAALGLASSLKWLMPLGGFGVALMYIRRATKGLERHLRPVGIAFILIGLSDLIGLTALLRDTANPVLYSWVSAFGWIWWSQQIILLAGAVILGLWTWFYLAKRFFTQFYMIIIGVIVAVFLLVSVGFTSLLLRDLQNRTLTNLNTAAQVLDYALSAKQSEAKSSAAQLAENSTVKTALSENKRDKLIDVTDSFLVEKKLSSVLVTSNTGQVLARGEDSNQWGDSLSGDSLVKRALLGTDDSSISTYEGVGAPKLQVKSAVPVFDNNGKVLGVVLTKLNLGSEFVDGLKQTTGLDSSIYAGNALAATSVTGPDGYSRPVGTKLSNNKIETTVLKDGNSYQGALRLQNRDVLGVFMPIKDVDNATVGMLLVAEPQSTILMTAGHSVELTFLLSAALLLFSLLPTYFIAKNLTRQLE